jgi:phage terminase large subunit-like protein
MIQAAAKRRQRKRRAADRPRMDRVTRAWLRDASDELAVRNGCRFDPLAGGYVVWWIERYCRLYEGEQAGEPLRLRGRHDDPLDAWFIHDAWDDEARAAAIDRAEHYAAGRASGGKRGAACDWQYEFVMRLFGWLRFSERWGRMIRRFREGDCWVPKKNKKSPTLAAIGLYLLCGDGEPGQKVGLCAKDGTQSRDIAGKHTLEMVRMSPELNGECKLNLNECSVTHLASRSILKPLSSSDERTKQAKEGFNGSLLVDETHVVDRDFMRRMSRAGISRSEPLLLHFSTAGNNPDGYGKARWDYGADVAAGRPGAENDQLLYLAYHAPQETPPEAVQGNRKEVIRLAKLANPAWGHTIHEDELVADWSQSRRTVGDTLDFLMYRLNVWQKAVNPWLPPGAWAACRARGEDAYTLDDLRGLPCIVGFDKSRNRDFSAFVGLFPEWGEAGLARYRLWPWIVAPRAYIEQHASDAPFLDWVAQGLLIPSPGDVIDVGHLFTLFGQIAEAHQVLALGYDPNRAEEITQLIEQGAQGNSGERLSQGYGVQRLPVGTQSGLMCSAIDDFEADVIEGRVVHPGHAVLDWMVGNTQTFDRGDRTKLDKPKKDSPKKIDAVVAAVIARAVAGMPEFRPARSIYEERGFLTV